jgi:predicted RNA-binding protein YlqC (UPF0109 family)
MSNAKSEGETLRELIQFVAEALVDIPEEVKTHVTESDFSAIIVTLRVARADVGKVIGKGGQTAKALRKILSAAATKHRKKSVLEIVE